MLEKITKVVGSLWYWVALAVLGVAMEAVALIYQYGLDYGPCVHCIHARIWVWGMVLLALGGVWLRRWPVATVVLHVLNAGLMYGLLQTSMILLGTERHTIAGTCSIESGLPSWFALDQWFPTLFAVWEPCSETPELLFGITMAEGLTAFSFTLMLLSAGVTVALAVAHLRRQP